MCRGKRTLRPIGFLRTLGQTRPEKFFDQRGEAEFANAEQPRGDHGVENSGREKIHGAGKGADRNRRLAGRFPYPVSAAQRRQIEAGQRIDQVIVTAETELDEAKLFEITVQTVGLGIDRDAIERLQLREDSRVRPRSK